MSGGCICSASVVDPGPPERDCPVHGEKACNCAAVDIGVGTLHEPGCPLGPPVCVHCGCPFDPHVPEPGAEPLPGCLRHDAPSDGFVCPGWEASR